MGMAAAISWRRSAQLQATVTGPGRRAPRPVNSGRRACCERRGTHAGEELRVMESLHGQVAIVTGAARGIGLGIATVLRDEGADVVVADLDEPGARTAAAQLAGAGEHAFGIGVDVTRKADTARMAAGAVSRWGRIDVLAANAG